MHDPGVRRGEWSTMKSVRTARSARARIDRLTAMEKLHIQLKPNRAALGRATKPRKTQQRELIAVVTRTYEPHTLRPHVRSSEPLLRKQHSATFGRKKMGTLSDSEIKSEIQQNRLVLNGEPSQAAGACYELRLGDVYYDLTESDQPINVSQDGTVLIKPGHRVVLITHEELVLPADIFARIVSKGSLFSVGLSHVATYADPGFSGHLGIVTQNISDKYIELSPMEPIAKVDFTRLSAPVNSLYNGQHGFRTKIWPIKTQLQKTYKQVSTDSRVRTEEEEAYMLLPDATATMLRYVQSRQRYMDYIIVVALIVNAFILLLVTSDFLSSLQGFAGMVLANSLVGLSTRFLKKRR